MALLAIGAQESAFEFVVNQWVTKSGTQMVPHNFTTFCPESPTAFPFRFKVKTTLQSVELGRGVDPAKPVKHEMNVSLWLI